MTTDISKYQLNHTMLRVKEPSRSIRFYELVGLKLVHKISMSSSQFDLYFLGYDFPESISHGKHWTDRQGLLELTHNYGTENDDSFKANNGNADPGKGFGHICISVDALQAVCQKIEDAGYQFQKKLTEGRMHSIAFALDPDGYWVELISYNDISKTEDVKETNPALYRFNHSMIRVKDNKTSLDFYQNTMGMQLLRTSENENAGFNLYFLAYPSDNGSLNTDHVTAGKEGVLELTWNYGTEKDSDFKYHNGNAEPQGFGHICVAGKSSGRSLLFSYADLSTVDDIEAACQRWEDKGVRWKKRMTDGKMRNIAFLLDPDDYWIEVVQNERLKPTGAW